jgi:hypothetical protein
VRPLVFVSIALLLAFGSRAQITDDSTRLVYGAHTTKWTTGYNLKNNVPESYRLVDTLLYQRERYHRGDQTDRRYHDLGFFGSAMYDGFFGLRSHPGRTSGYSAYDQYFKGTDDFRFYDTKSPFMDLFVLFGGRRRAKIDFAFSRNVNENWNVGFDINRITMDKQLGATGVGDRVVESAAFDFYTHYKSSKIPYSALFSYTSMNHRIAELGGVFVPEDPVELDYYRYRESEVWLNNAQSQEKRKRFYLMQEYKLGSGFQIYHELDWTTQNFRFTDFNDGTESMQEKYEAFYPRFNLNNDTTQERMHYRALTNEVGLKGNIKDAFYRFYAKRRDLSYDLTYVDRELVGEVYVGALLRFDWKDKFSVIGQGELSVDGIYQISGDLKSDLIRLRYVSQRAYPSFLMQRYTGNHHGWSNNFTPIFSNQMEGAVTVEWKSFDFEPSVSFTTISGFMYVDAAQEAVQASAPVVMSRGGGKLGVDFLQTRNKTERFRFEAGGFATNVGGGGADGVRIPDLMYSGRLYWAGLWFNNMVPVEVGANVFGRTSFYGNAYTPVIQQFYVQDVLMLDAYNAVDVFLNMKIRNFSAFVKYTHFNQQQGSGYMNVPLFPGQPRVFDFGVRWLFFD